VGVGLVWCNGLVHEAGRRHLRHAAYDVCSQGWLDRQEGMKAPCALHPQLRLFVLHQYLAADLRPRVHPTNQLWLRVVAW
jgi:hypothetical protein